MKGVILPAPDPHKYDANNEAQTRRLLQQQLRDLQAQLDAITSYDGTVLYLELDGGSIATTYDDTTDGGSLADRPTVTYDAGVID
jgi:hypothetical protein